MADHKYLDTNARLLIQRAWGESDAKFGFGSFSGAVYDSAWVSMIIKRGDSRQWLFPECFCYVLETQSPGGGWDAGASQVDAILNTAASLLSIKRHLQEPLQLDIDARDLQHRVSSATAALQSLLGTWNVNASSHVGFEILIPAFLVYLENEGISFYFPGREELLELNRAKLSMIKPEVLYSKAKATLIHSLEAFIGKIDFDRVAHHTTGGSMMASPSASAAYLMNANLWDEETEQYLGYIVRSRGDGSVPGAFPSTYFEYSWMISTLLRGGFASTNLACPELNMITDILQSALTEGGGIIGFAPNVGADVDDTAKTITVLKMLHLDEHCGLERMKDVFEVKTHFQTYKSERNPSVSANCNVLVAIMHQKDVAYYSPQILKIVEFLSSYWWSTDVSINDKWNLSTLYPRMLLVQAFSDLLNLMDTQRIPDMLSQEMKSRIAVVIFQACYRTILGKDSNGSWGGSAEETAYAVLILSEARRFSFLGSIRQKAEDAMNEGARFLQSLDILSLPPEYLWVEKVTYSAALLTSSYVLAARKAAICVPGATELGLCLNVGISTTQKNRQYAKLFSQTLLFRGIPEWQIQASLSEAIFFEPLLREHRLDIFPREDMAEDKYFDIIPFTWTACNNLSRAFASPSLLYEMMVLSFLNYQADEFMEAVAAPSFTDTPQRLHELIMVLVSRHTDDTGTASLVTGLNDKIVQPLSKFVSYVLDHPQVASSCPWDRAHLQKELQVFLLAHAQQAEDSAEFATQARREIYCSPQSTFFQWVRTTAADHTSCPYSFAFFSCLLSTATGGDGGCFPTASLKYFAEAVCRHLASMCRLYNDYGSVSRDSLEHNLNCINFPEFETLMAVDVASAEVKVNGEGGEDVKLKMKKDCLFNLAEYERSSWNEALERLGQEFQSQTRQNTTFRRIGHRRMEILRMFCDVTDLYGQIYYIRDIASRMKGP